MAVLSSFLVGLVFALGLGLSGMTQPGRINAFLDVLGDWNPSLMLVMAGALLIHAPLARAILKRRRPVLAERFQVPGRKDISGRLVLGSAFFGIGWGLSGFCPAPAVTALASLDMNPAVFVASMVLGMGAFEVTNRGRT